MQARLLCSFVTAINKLGASVGSRCIHLTMIIAINNRIWNYKQNAWTETEIAERHNRISSFAKQYFDTTNL
jgi:hypothetical protein